MKSDVLADSISDAAALPGGRYGVIIAVVAAVAALGVDARAYQPNGLARDVRRYPAPGILADAGGHKLHLRVMGAEHPGPTVILETGSGSFSSAWGWVQPEVAKFARVVSYDRA